MATTFYNSLFVGLMLNIICHVQWKLKEFFTKIWAADSLWSSCLTMNSPRLFYSFVLNVVALAGSFGVIWASARSFLNCEGGSVLFLQDNLYVAFFFSEKELAPIVVAVVLGTEHFYC